MCDWISVKDRLPDTDKFLAITKWKHIMIAQKRSWEKDWIVGGMRIEKDILYWMPLPEPPKEV